MKNIIDGNEVGVRICGGTVSIIQKVKGKRHRPIWENTLVDLHKKDAIKLALLLIKAAQQ